MIITILIVLIFLAAFIYDAEWLLCLWFPDYRIIVNCERQPYLIRWYIFRSTRVALFVHKFVRSDEDRALHDHPWPFLVIPLWRGYIEHSSRARSPDEPLRDISQYRLPLKDQRIESVTRVLPLIGTRYRGIDYRHRVQLLGGDNPRPAWSLFFRFTKVREWGFWLPQGFVLWNKWWQDKCE